MYTNMYLPISESVDSILSLRIFTLQNTDSAVWPMNPRSGIELAILCTLLFLLSVLYQRVVDLKQLAVKTPGSKSRSSKHSRA